MADENEAAIAGATLTGSAGEDLLQGGGGADFIDGGAGNDEIHGDATPAPGGTVWISDVAGNLYRIDDISGGSVNTHVGQMGLGLGDIGMAPDGTLYGVHQNYATNIASLYAIDPNTAAITEIGQFPPGEPNLNGLTFGPDGMGYASGSKIYAFDPADPSGAQEWWSHPDGGSSPGDVAMLDGKLYAAWNVMVDERYVTQLIEFTPAADGTVDSWRSLGQLPPDTYGLTTGPGGALYAFTSTDGLALDLSATPAAGMIPSTTLAGAAELENFYGAASAHEIGVEALAAGDDTLSGGDGDDLVYGGGGDDTIYGGEGYDRLFGGEGNDQIFGGEGIDIIQGDAGNDTIFGDGGNDTIEGEAGDDTIYGDVGDDYLKGEAGDDTLYGGQGNDTLLGGDGDDVIHLGNHAGGGYDVAQGGDGDDRFIVSGSDASNSISGGGGHDTLDLSQLNYQTWVTFGASGSTGSFDSEQFDSGSFDGIEVVVGGSGSDALNAARTAQSVTFYGGGGDDNLTGSTAGDLLFGGDDIDNINGYSGDDTVYGGAGGDWLSSGTGTDTIYGGDGADFLYGETGENFIYGGADADVIRVWAGGTVDGGEDVTDGEDHDQLWISGVSSVVFDADNRENGIAYLTNGQTLSFTNIESVYADNVRLSGPKDGVVSGTSGNDTIDGSYTGDFHQDRVDAGDALFPGAAPDDDVIEGLGGDDTIRAGLGDDYVYGGSGDDSVDGGQGDDTLYGESGDDRLNGGEGDDLAYGGQGSDTIDGGEGADSLFGGEGADVIEGGEGDDYIRGGGAPSQGATLWGSDGAGNLYRIDNADSTPSQHLVGNMDFVAGDIAMTSDGRLYGVDMSYPSQVYHINTLTGTSIHVGTMPQGTSTINGLGFGPDGAAYATGGKHIYRFDPENPGGAEVWWSDSTYNGSSAGDIVFQDDKAYLAWSTGNGNSLIELSIGDDGNVESTRMLGQLPGQTFGISVGPSGEFYAFGGPGIYKLDISGAPVNGGTGAIPSTLLPNTGQVVQSIGGYYGGTSSHEVHADPLPDEADSLFGGAGNDTILGDEGNDTLFGGVGDDRLYGGDDNDRLFGETGDDTLYGDAGDDRIDGGDGRDTLYGGTGDDRLNGGAGNDTLFGGAGNDTLAGGAGDDTLDGGDGNDWIRLDDGHDSAYGGLGQDTFALGADTRTGVIDGGEGDANPADDFDTIRLGAHAPGTYRVIYSAENPENGVIEFLDANGDVASTIEFFNIENIVPCFTPGSLVATEAGEVAVEDIQPGQRVLTRDGGYRPVRWVGRRDLGLAEVLAQPSFAPVRIARGALVKGLPLRDMVVSPQHRMLIGGGRAQLLFGEDEVLVAAIHLVGRPGIERLPAREVSYIHLLFDAHEVICVDGAWTESYQPGEASLPGEGDPQRDEIYALFPDLAAGKSWRAARPSLKRFEAQLLELG